MNKIGKQPHTLMDQCVDSWALNLSFQRKLSLCMRNCNSTPIPVMLTEDTRDTELNDMGFIRRIVLVGPPVRKKPIVIISSLLNTNDRPLVKEPSPRF